MRKTQFALAALALVASTAALADGVKISGIIDVGVGHNTGKGTYVSQGAWSDHSGIVFSGDEDLGAGNKAFFVLDQGFTQNGDAGNGGNGGLFSRQTLVGLSSTSAGSISAGQQLSPFILSNAISNQGVGDFWVNRVIMAGGLNAAAAPTAAAGGSQVGGFFIANSIQYQTPSINGWTATALTSTKTGANDGLLHDAVKDDQYTSFAINGNISGVNLTAASQDRKDAYRSYIVGGSYQFNEQLNLSANYINHKDNGADSVASYAVGAGYKVTPAITLVAQYATNDVSTGNQSLTNIGASYALSKRTAAYVTYVHATNGAIAAIADRGSYATTGTSNNNAVIGMTHSF